MSCFLSTKRGIIFNATNSVFVNVCASLGLTLLFCGKMCFIVFFFMVKCVFLCFFYIMVGYFFINRAHTHTHINWINIDMETGHYEPRSSPVTYN